MFLCVCSHVCAFIYLRSVFAKKHISDIFFPITTLSLLFIFYGNDIFFLPFMFNWKI
jgi:hypothetical protein